MSLTPEDLRSAATLLEEADGVQTEIADKEREFEASIAALRAREAELRDEAARLIGTISRRNPASAASPGGRAKASPEDVMAVLNRVPGSNGTDIARELGVVPATANKLLKQLVDDGAVRAEGERRGRKYFAA